jgi:hypothetical protein
LNSFASSSELPFAHIELAASGSAFNKVKPEDEYLVQRASKCLA